MLISWLIWFILLIFILFVFIFADPAGGLILCLVFILITITDLIVMLVSGRKITAEFDFPKNCMVNEGLSGRIILKSNSHIKPVYMKLRFLITNILTDESRIEIANAGFTRDNEFIVELNLKSELAGCVAIRCEKVKKTDWFGLFSKKFVPFFIKDQESHINVVPEVEEVNFENIFGVSSETAGASSDELIGNDLSELYEHRDYVLGDSKKSVNWKLSARNDRLIVRIGSRPSMERVLIAIETGNTGSITGNVCRAFSNQAGRVISISIALTAMGVGHCIAWVDAQSKKLNFININDEEDVYGGMETLLSIGHMTEESDVVGKCEAKLEERFSNVILVSYGKEEKYIPEV